MLGKVSHAEVYGACSGHGGDYLSPQRDFLAICP
jgi:hypothetical protein